MNIVLVHGSYAGTWVWDRSDPSSSGAATG